MRRQLGRGHFSDVGIEGALFTVVLLPLALLDMGSTATATTSTAWDLARLLCAALASVSLLLGAAYFVRHTRWGRAAALGGIVGTWTSILPWLLSAPFIALSGSVLALVAGFAIADRRITVVIRPVSTHAERCRQRACWATITAVVCGIVLLANDSALPSLLPLFASAGIAAAAIFMALHWARAANDGTAHWRRLAMLCVAILGTATVGAAMVHGWMAWALILCGGASWLLLPTDEQASSTLQAWLAPLIDHPARMLVSTFLGLCLLGTVALMLPVASSDGQAIAIIDALFTAVSAVCVTGLIVLDTPHDFSFVGQVSILLLIQLGGLGIMSISTTALHVLGKRMSLRQERVLHAMNEDTSADLTSALVLVVKFTLIAEIIGACLLFPQFMIAGDAFISAAWRALFTAVSAYCNAGFALQSNSLVPYAQMPGILHTVGALIIVGGMAPVVALAIPRWLRGGQVSAACRLALGSTAILLVLGFVAVLALEWRETLAEMPIFHKLHNAWFQSITLRTAGFNAIDMGQVAHPSLLVMLVFMFIGGSPGGAAGGIKTTTVAILALAMWATIRGRSEVVIRDRRLPPNLVYRAVAVVTAGFLVWLLLLLSLSLTQTIGLRDLLFETTSALATVGLSTGATAELDGIGKVLVIVGMFIGRIGPLTLFMLLADDTKIERIQRPDAHLSIT